ncbi:hypothetical protein Cni_G22203 [Canna indica]|uniref:HMG box domain-containing protein n=1 Tax=Canna indica TaxID=4628 RepID=A0AAQ3KUQ1_9LILI|nr:hypothetical protein Cni_G22203 [Canna indica]
MKNIYSPQYDAITRIADVYREISRQKPSLRHLSRWIAIPLPTPYPSFALIIAPLFSALSPHGLATSRCPLFSLSALRILSHGLAMKRGRPPKDASKKAESKLSVKKGSEVATKRTRKPKAEKDPNKPKRPPSAFFVFMEEFRKTFKEKNPNNKSVAVVGKAGGGKWKSLSESEKAPYVAKAAKLKTEYTKKIANYNKNQSGAGSHAAAADEDESDKSKSEVNDEEEDEEGSGEEEDDE